jgi:sugar/nucleoside kinase (ribokinase family)
MSLKKVLGIGSPIVDLLVRVEDSFIDGIEGDKGGMMLVDASSLDAILEKSGVAPEKAPGGSAANTIFGLAQLGTPTALLGKVGADDEAAFYKSRYERMGGDVFKLKVSPSAPTGRCLSLVTPDSERTMRTDLGAAAELAPDDVSSADFAGMEHVHVEGYLLFNEPLTRRVLDLAKGAGATVSFDLASFEVVRAVSGFLPELLEKYVDIVFANEEEASAFIGGGSPEKALDALSERCSVAAVKLGPDGALVKNGADTARISAVPAEAIDTTGAGDLWASGFLHEYLNGSGDIAKSGALGAVLGAAVVQVMGAALPEDVWDVIRRGA